MEYITICIAHFKHEREKMSDGDFIGHKFKYALFAVKKKYGGFLNITPRGG